MPVTYKDGELTLDLVQVFNNLDGQQKMELIESLSFQPEIIRYVCRLILDAILGHGIAGDSQEMKDAIFEIAMQADELRNKQFKELQYKLRTALNSNIALRAEIQDILKEIHE